MKFELGWNSTSTSKITQKPLLSNGITFYLNQLLIDKMSCLASFALKSTELQTELVRAKVYELELKEILKHST